MLAVFADGFTPSASAKSAPEIVSPEYKDYKKDVYKKEQMITAGIINADSFVTADELKNEKEPIILVSNKKGEPGKIVGAVFKIKVEVVPYKDKNLLDIVEEENVDIAYEELKESESFADVIEELKEYFTDEEISKFSATQIFYIKPTVDVKRYIDFNIKLNLRLIFKKSLTVRGKAPIIVVKDVDTEEWMAIDPKTILEDWYSRGTFSVDLRNFGTVVFLEPRTTE